MKICASCKTHNHLDARFCKRCATPLTIDAEEAAGWEEQRRDVLFELLGEPGQTVGQENWLAPVGPVSLHIWGPGCVQGMEDFDLHVVMTSGMSNVRLPASGTNPRRLELVAWVPAMSPSMAQYLLGLASFPGLTGNPLGPGSTLIDDEPFFGGSPMRATVFVPYPEAPFCRIPETLRVEEDPVELLFPIPLTVGERERVVAEGPVPVLDQFDPPFDYMFNPWRTPLA